MVSIFCVILLDVWNNHKIGSFRICLGELVKIRFNLCPYNISCIMVVSDVYVQYKIWRIIKFVEFSLGS